MVYLNPYSLRYRDDIYIYIRGKSLELVKIDNNPQNSKYLNRLLNDGDNIDSIEEFFGYTLTKRLLEENILIVEKINENSKTSRTEGYYSVFYDLKYKKMIDNLNHKTILVLGAGALGTHISWGLSAYSVKKIIIVDFDEIEVSNLNRQMFYDYDDIGKRKIEVIKKKLEKLNKDLIVEAISKKIIDVKTLIDIIEENKDIDFIVKAIDTPMNCLEIVNEVSVNYKIPYISGGFNGKYLLIDQIYIPGISSCYKCKKIDNDIQISNKIESTGPTIPEMPQILSGMMVKIIINILIGNIEGITLDKIILYDLVTDDFIKIPYKKNNNICNLCTKNNIINEDNDNNRVNIKEIAMLVCTYIISFFIVKNLEPYDGFLILGIPVVFNIIYFNLSGYFKVKIDKVLMISILSYIPFIIYMIIGIFKISNNMISIIIQAIISLFLLIISIEGISLIGYYITFSKKYNNGRE